MRCAPATPAAPVPSLAPQLHSRAPQLDNYAYILLLPPTIRNKTENLPPLNLGLKEGQMFHMRETVVNYYSWIVSALIAVCSCAIYAVWCPWHDADAAVTSDE